MHDDIVMRVNEIGCELERSGFIMAMNNINKLLQYIASNATLKNMLERANMIVNYAGVYKDATVYPNAFNMPENTEAVFVLVTGILHGFTRGKIDFVKFLQTRFPAENIDISYYLYYVKVMKIYISSILILLEKNEKSVNIDVREINVSVPNVAIEQILNTVDELGILIKNDSSMSDQKASECLEILSGIEIALGSNNIRYVKIIWYAIKNILTAKAYVSLVKALETVMINYSII